MKNKKFSISREKREKLINEIKTFFYEERDEKIGDLAANIVLDFFMDKLAPEFYNEGVNDAYRYMQDRIEDLLEIQI
ncbi:DUF2164 domain-containing protein [Caproiciproducens sp. MSJ-32]|uniref:DUF2164 domain-containing protein n=1 Tax=Caproiciproducens sp. MSJ-32 TaxID=2841527 RepID=UPI001C10F8F4|nr:DUF2164 domain-containing protein [Caproiciproducens sp. MSJ-32]MBU5455821.1 DUF2164 domain-containing protein [Caproiciproducens sp. MSJ-32]